MFDPLPDDLARALDRARPELGSYASLHYCAAVESTNDTAMALAAEGAPEGTAVLADVQHGGRGRRGHTWWSPPGAGLYLSVVLRPDLTTGRLPLVTIAVGVAAAEAVLAETGLPVELKWPNDLVIGRPWRKLGGVLTEAVTTGGNMTAMVAGIGINLLDVAAPAPVAAIATSLEAELGRRCDRAMLAVALLQRLRVAMQLVHQNDRRAIVDRWRGFARGGLGATVQWHDAEGDHSGIARDIDEDGALLVAGRRATVRVMAGVVRWEGLSGD